MGLITEHNGIAKTTLFNGAAHEALIPDGSIRSAWPAGVDIRKGFFDHDGVKYRIIDLRDFEGEDFDRHVKNLAAFYRDGFNETGIDAGVNTLWPDDERVEAMLRHRLRTPGVAFVVCPENDLDDIHGTFLMEHEYGLRTDQSKIAVGPRAVELDVLVKQSLRGKSGLGSKITFLGLHNVVQNAREVYKEALSDFDAETYEQNIQEYFWGRLSFKSDVILLADIKREVPPNVLAVQDLTFRPVHPEDAHNLAAFLQSPKTTLTGQQRGWKDGQADKFIRTICGNGNHALAYLAENAHGEIVGFCSARVAIRRANVSLRSAFCAIQDPSFESGGLNTDSANLARSRQKLMVNELVRHIANAGVEEVEAYGISAGPVELTYSRMASNIFDRYIDNVTKDEHFLGIGTKNLRAVFEGLYKKINSDRVVLNNEDSIRLNGKPRPTVGGAAIGNMGGVNGEIALEKRHHQQPVRQELIRRYNRRGLIT